MSKQIPIPEAAKAAGMTTLVFEDDFESYLYRMRCRQP